MKSIYVTTIQVHEVPLSLVANDGGDFDNLEFDPDDRGELVFARGYAGVQPFAIEAGLIVSELVANFEGSAITTFNVAQP
jgi:hypothetical protein